jgi:serine O-acetyltransferase
LDALALDGGEVSLSEFEDFLVRYFGDDTAGQIRADISRDIAFFRDKDPASTNYDEQQVLSVRRGMAAIAAHRVFQAVLNRQPELLYHMEVIAKYVQKDTNVEIHPGARIAAPFAVDHGHGTVIGATSNVGHDVYIYHGVTLGATGRVSRGGRRHPNVGNNVFFGNGSQVLGPSVLEDDISIASGAIVQDSYLHSGVHVFLNVRVATVEVPPNSRVYASSRENPRRYWASTAGNQQPEWIEFERADVSEYD